MSSEAYKRSSTAACAASRPSFTVRKRSFDGSKLFFRGAGGVDASEETTLTETTDSLCDDDESIKVCDGDVISGRGKLAFHHGMKLSFSAALELTRLFSLSATAGNVRFRELVAQAVEAYKLAEKRLGKPLVVQSVIDAVHAEGGRFLRRDPVLGKVSQSLDGLRPVVWWLLSHTTNTQHHLLFVASFFLCRVCLTVGIARCQGAKR